MSTFSKGDRVEWLVWSEGRLGFLLTDAIDDDPDATVLVNWDNGGQETVKIGALRKVEPEFVVGQQVSGVDYTRLPVGSVVECSSHEGPGHGPNGIECKPLTKVSDAEWDDGGRHDATRLYDPRTLTHLGDGLADWERELLAEVDAEDKDDLYVEPEPLKEGDWCLVWAKVDHLYGDGAARVRTPGLGIGDRLFVATANAFVRPDAGQVPPWVKEREEVPVTVTISGTRVFSEESGAPMVRLETGPGSYALIPVANISSITEGGAS